MPYKDPEKRKARQRAYYYEHKHEIRARAPRKTTAQSRAWYWQHTYGLSPEAVDNMLITQGNKCAICQKEFGLHTWHIDHDHKTGKVRGLLCAGCNRAVAPFEVPGLASKIEAYLVGR